MCNVTQSPGYQHSTGKGLSFATDDDVDVFQEGNRRVTLVSESGNLSLAAPLGSDQVPFIRFRRKRNLLPTIDEKDS